MIDPGDQRLRGEPPRDSTDPLQGGLFEPRARTTDPDTSHAAAASMVDEAGHQRARIRQELVDGPLTADSLDERIGWRPTTAGRRLPELRELGLVRMLESKAPTRSGRKARLWEAV